MADDRADLLIPGSTYKVLSLHGFREGRHVKYGLLSVLSDDIWLIKNIPVIPLFEPWS
jgi:hypothetical protein